MFYLTFQKLAKNSQELFTPLSINHGHELSLITTSHKMIKPKSDKRLLIIYCYEKQTNMPVFYRFVLITWQILHSRRWYRTVPLGYTLTQSLKLGQEERYTGNY